MTHAWPANSPYDYIGHRGISLYPYPAVMPLPLARDLLSRYARCDGWILDPFVGSGTTLRASISLGRPAIGVDLNPLACLISRLTAWSAAGDVNTKAIHDARTAAYDCLSKATAAPSGPLADRARTWFHPRTWQLLAGLAHAVKSAPVDNQCADYLHLAMARTVRRCSLAKMGELKLWRRKETEPAADPFKVFTEESLALLRDMVLIRDQYSASPTEYRVIDGDAVEILPTLQYPVSTVITSPPYGDSWTTVAYGNATLLPRIWLGAIRPDYVSSNPATEDARSLGGAKRARQAGDAGIARVIDASGTLRRASAAILDVNEVRAKDMNNFFLDLSLVFDEISKKLDDNGVVIIVAGPRTIASVQVDTGLVMTELLEAEGYAPLVRHSRRITGKRLPSRSMQRTAGVISTINSETIDVLRRGSVR